MKNLKRMFLEPFKDRRTMSILLLGFAAMYVWITVLHLLDHEWLEALSTGVFVYMISMLWRMVMQIIMLRRTVDECLEKTTWMSQEYAKLVEDHRRMSIILLAK